MARLQDLPSEIIAMIINVLPISWPGSDSDRSSFARTCRDIFEIAKPEIYRSIRVCTSEPPSAFNALLVAHRHHQFVKKLAVHLRGSGNWPTIAGPVLALLRGDFPGLSCRIEELTLVLPKDPCTGDGLYWTSRHDFCKKTLEHMNEVLAAAATNSTITRLSISRLPPYDSPVFKTATWHTLLSRLESFGLELLDERVLECDSYQHWSLSHGSHSQLPDFFTRFTGAGLAENFFNHMSSTMRWVWIDVKDSRDYNIVPRSFEILHRTFRDYPADGGFQSALANLTREDFEPWTNQVPNEA